MILALILIGFFIVAAALAFLATKAPVGYQDDQGFHFVGQRQKAHQPEDQKTPFWFQISWAKPALGLGVLVLVFLTIANQPDHAQTEIDTPRQPSIAARPEIIAHKNPMLAGPSAQLFPNFCQRDTEVR